jgi:hypothetical protein
MPPIGTPGCTGGGRARIGALYTGLGPVCGTIIRGAGGGGAVGRAGVETDEGAEVETEAGAEGMCVEGMCVDGGGVTGRAGGAATGVVAAGATMTGRGAAAGGGATDAGGGGGVGLITGGATVVGRLTAAGDAAAGFSGTAGATGGATARGAGGGATASFFCVIALSTSPGREMFERSIFVLISSSPREARELDLPAEDDPSAEERIYTRTFSASWSSKELE